MGTKLDWSKARKSPPPDIVYSVPRSQEAKDRFAAAYARYASAERHAGREPKPPKQWLDERANPAAPKPAAKPVPGKVKLPSPDDVERGKTAAGGWTRATLASWGVAWPPPKGWRKVLEIKWRAAHYKELPQRKLRADNFIGTAIIPDVPDDAPPPWD